MILICFRIVVLVIIIVACGSFCTVRFAWRKVIEKEECVPNGHYILMELHYNGHYILMELPFIIVVAVVAVDQIKHFFNLGGRSSGLLDNISFLRFLQLYGLECLLDYIRLR